MSFAIVGVGIAAAGAGYQIFQGERQHKEANAINPQQPQFVESPYAKQQLATAQQSYNAPMPGSNQYRQDINNAQGNYLDFANRNATDSGQLLQLGGLSQGMTNNAFSDLQTKEAGYKTSMLDNLNAAYRAMIGENDKKFGYEYQNYRDDVNAKTALQGASMQNTWQGINSLGSDAFVASQYFNGSQTPITRPTANTPTTPIHH